MRKVVRAAAAVFDFLTVITLLLIFYMEYELPDQYYVLEGETVRFSYPVLLDTPEQPLEGAETAGESYQVDLKLMGAIPIKTVEVSVVDRKTVRCSGAPFGIKMFTDGLMVVGMSEVTGEGQRINPAREAGVEIGDIIETVNGVRLRTNEQLGELVEQSGGEPVELTVRRGEEQLTFQVRPVQSVGDRKYRLGVWVRDSSAGIGTMTYYDPNSGLFTGLGHAVCDVDTGELMPLSDGEIVSAEITGCKRGESGEPGELKGRFSGGSALGWLSANTPTGVYGYLQSRSVYLGEEVPVALSHEVRPGRAVIRTTISGSIPREYEVELEKISTGSGAGGQNMIVHVTDPELLAQTGGIVQGMSGSPILQNGMLVGSVTHVFVNDPTRGFGIFAETIYNDAKNMCGTVDNAA